MRSLLSVVVHAASNQGQAGPGPVVLDVDGPEVEVVVSVEVLDVEDAGMQEVVSSVVVK